MWVTLSERYRLRLDSIVYVEYVREEMIGNSNTVAFAGAGAHRLRLDKSELAVLERALAERNARLLGIFCHECDGKGYRIRHDNLSKVGESSPCPRCKGSGVYINA